MYHQEYDASNPAQGLPTLLSLDDTLHNAHGVRIMGDELSGLEPNPCLARFCWFLRSFHSDVIRAVVLPICNYVLVHTRPFPRQLQHSQKIAVHHGLICDSDSGRQLPQEHSAWLS